MKRVLEVQQANVQPPFWSGWLLALVLFGCGNTQPQANAGLDQLVFEGQVVRLQGSGSDEGGVRSYTWSQVQGEPVGLSTPNRSGTAFTAPAPPAVAGFPQDVKLVFRLTVKDEDGLQATDDVTIIVRAQANLQPVARAGYNQTVAAGYTVKLNGTNSADPIAQGLTYNWAPVAPTTLVPTGSETAEASFVAPAAPVTLVFQLTVIDAVGQVDTDTVTVTVTNDNVVFGTLSYTMVPYGTDAANSGLNFAAEFDRPMRNVVVRAIDHPSGDIRAEGRTGLDGRYSLAVGTPPGQVRIVAVAQLKSLDEDDGGWDIRVVDNTTNTNPTYAVQTEPFTPTPGSPANYNAPTGWDPTSNAYTSERLAAPFAVLDAAYQGLTTVQKAAAVLLAPLEINWSINNRPAIGDVANGDIGSTVYRDGEIYLLGDAASDTDEFDTAVVIAEFAHFIEEQLGRRDAPPIAFHSPDDVLDHRVAFSEGWSNAFAGMALGSPLYSDSSFNADGTPNGFTYDLELNFGQAPQLPGWFNEASIQMILYDLFDNPPNDDDGLALGFAPFFEALFFDLSQTEALTSIFPFIHSVVGRRPATTTNVRALLEAQNIVGADVDIFARNETNNGGGNLLPIYEDVSIGLNRTVCSTNQFGVFNAAGVSRFLRLQLEAPETFRIEVVPASSNAGQNPEVVLYNRAERLSSLNPGPNEVLQVTALPAGVYIIEVYEAANRTTQSIEQACFDISLKR